MGIAASALGVGLLGAISGFLLLSIIAGNSMPRTVSALAKNPRFILACFCLVLAAILGFAML